MVVWRSGRERGKGWRAIRERVMTGESGLGLELGCEIIKHGRCFLCAWDPAHAKAFIISIKILYLHSIHYNYQTVPKKLPKFYMKQVMLSIAYRNSFKAKSKFIITITPNLIVSFSTIWFFFSDVPACKHCTS